MFLSVETFPWPSSEPASTCKGSTSARWNTTTQYYTPVTSHLASWVCVWVYKMYFLTLQQNVLNDFAPSASPTLSVPQQWVVLETESQLQCHADGFYPPPVTFSWTRDGKVIQDPYTTESHLNPDGYYTAAGNLTVYPSREDQNVTFGCNVSHNGSDQELNFKLNITCQWHPSITGKSNILQKRFRSRDTCIYIIYSTYISFLRPCFGQTFSPAIAL